MWMILDGRHNSQPTVLAKYGLYDFRHRENVLVNSLACRFSS